jgi:5-hydroxyisourate hydrolase
MSISTHILNIATGKPAAGVAVELDRNDDGEWTTLNAEETNYDGRIQELLLLGVFMHPGLYCARFATGAYFQREGIQSLYPFVEITFMVTESEDHYHIPLLLSPNSYTTYRGS